MLNESVLITDVEQKGQYIYFVARGVLVEKNGRLGDANIQ